MLYELSLTWILVVGAALCAPERVQGEAALHDARDHADSRPQGSPEQPVSVEKRSPHYDFGLGKRAYSYVSEYKRLPVYNFGLGKRATRPYSMGLGKRSISEEDQNEEELANDIEIAAPEELYDQYDDSPLIYEEKRARPYSFGLGKRFSDISEEKRRMYDLGLGKRLPRYNFGLGKRARNYDFGLGKRARNYDFGLGKRARSYDFGLGKRYNKYYGYDFGLGKREQRFNFGLGKRSANDANDDVDV